MSAAEPTRVEVGQAVETEEALPIRVLTRSHLWITWGRIAMRDEGMAHAARAEAAGLPAGSNLGPLLIRETDAGVAGVCAAAFALEALYKELLTFDPPLLDPDVQEHWKERHWQYVAERSHEMLKRAIDNNVLSPTIRQDLDWLFDSRDNAVHFMHDLETPELHPLGTNVAPLNVHYSADSATRAVDLLVQVITACRDHPKSPLRTWSISLRHAFDDLLALRGAAT